VGRQALDGEGAADAQFAAVFVGPVVEGFAGGVAGDGSVNLLLAGAAQFPPLVEQVLGGLGPVVTRFAGEVRRLQT